MQTHRSIPDRSDYILHPESSANPEPFLSDTVESLLRAGANLIAIPCNTAHYFLPAIEARFASLPVRFLHMPHLAAQAALKSSRRIGLLATTGTLASGLYQQSLQRLAPEHELELLLPREQDQLMDTIFAQQGIKAGFADGTTAEGRANQARLCAIVGGLVERGARAVVAGCTELPLLLSAEHLAQAGLPPISIINPAACLADEVVRRTLRDRY
jgi:aspartate racemase